jgi:tripartite-type tricarboxylate transporter receptor subunit TctC
MKAFSIFSLFLLLLGSFGVTNTLAADYPSKPIEIIVTYAPGGSTDTSARITAPKASKILGQPIVVINKPGAGGALGYDQVAKSAPDGYTLVLYAINAVILKAINPSLSFHPVQDFAPVSNLITQANILVVSPNSKITSVAQYVEAAKKSPGKVTFGSSGMGSSQHLSGELFKRVAKVDMVHVPHKGSAPCVTALLGGHIESGFINAPDVMEQVRGGKLRAIGVTTAQRIVELPNVPTIAESGYPGFEVVSWMGICAPGKTPRPIVEKLANAYKQVMEDPEVPGKMKTMGFIPTHMPPEAFSAWIKKEFDKFSTLAKEANIKME